ncbi:MAG: sigma-70 family RNA polymerase sigma factor [Cyclobacteriaceae bacterium]|nr:sigma-70 family RNA polymerase sigma factor [Cyclobacteriaceae bacterium]MCH8516011.1 sigma-70 family RNA polymerase sigma factor [Cyclobacteriaceae bacterium]
MKRSKTEIIALLKTDSELIVSEIYKRYRKKFMNWTKFHYGLSEEVSEDVFQDSIYVLYYNVKTEKLTELQSSLQTYLFALGKNILSKKEYRPVKEINTEDFSLNESQDLTPWQLIEKNDDQLHLIKIIKSIGEPCYSILKHFYFDSFSMESIAERLGYKNENVVKSKKLQCLNKLREIYQKEKDD